MICNKCNHKLPNDSKFCQYCGSKLETGFVVSMEILDEQINSEGKLESSSADDISARNNSKDFKSKESLKTVVKMQGNTENKVVSQKTNTVIQNVSKKNVNKRAENKLIFFSTISATILSAISLVVSLFFLIALCCNEIEFYDYWERDYLDVLFLMELCSFLAFGVFFGIALSSFIKGKFKLLASFAPILVIMNFVILVTTLWNYSWFADAACITGMVSAGLIFIFSLFPVFFAANEKRKIKKYKSIKYRESCYKKVDKIHGYLERGIITKEEYKKTKQDILKDVIY